ncbi:helix-turn-helix domain-containing protein [Pseudomonas denitrificans (nom. rej.)]|uniref:Helix-turn-helix transcriptional regulator n=1 Tax=Pseudomonas denitrificans TaxID=43306 RepID=A0A9X7MYL5_PSEDE|nr:helix-turn-helix transcriptional regulator [Pseudomonas denitrificans (nom. rej.)]QEY71748.1 helix-turn-helix transcriptional regulator [Pseudomonas denitrificans (nom. rej.)]
MELNKTLGQALKRARLAAGQTQEDFSPISSRTYISALERGLQSPTLEKLDELCEQLGIHPVTLIAASYLIKNRMAVEELKLTLDQELMGLGF